jgi:hypothetical protein
VIDGFGNNGSQNYPNGLLISSKAILSGLLCGLVGVAVAMRKSFAAFDSILAKPPFHGDCSLFAEINIDA